MYLPLHLSLSEFHFQLVVPMYDILSLEKKMTAFVIPNALQITTRKAKYAFASFLARDTVYDVIHNVWRLARPDVSSVDGGSTRASVEEFNTSARASLDGLPPIPGPDPIREKGPTSDGKKAPVQKVTTCGCGKSGQHYSEKAMECVVPGAPDKVYTLLFASAFMKEFMREEQKLIGKSSESSAILMHLLNECQIFRYPIGHLRDPTLSSLAVTCLTSSP